MDYNNKLTFFLTQTFLLMMMVNKNYIISTQFRTNDAYSVVIIRTCALNGTPIRCKNPLILQLLNL